MASTHYRRWARPTAQCAWWTSPADPYGVIVAEAGVSGTGHRVDEATITTTGRYLACAYLHTGDNPTGPAEIVRQARVEITTFADKPPAKAKLKSCGRLGGPRHISHIRARNVTCRRARSLARRWGARTPRPVTIGRYACRVGKPVVNCTAPKGRKVRFRYR